MATPSQILGQAAPELGEDKKWRQAVAKPAESKVIEFLRQIVVEIFQKHITAPPPEVLCRGTNIVIERGRSK